jgi:Cof subfamily protein (haloacid dehalogenase superfamily)
MSGPIRLLVCDIDGTLVRPDKTLGEPVVEAVGRALAAGVAVSLISARPPSGMLWIARRLGLAAPLGAFNGGTLIDPDGTVRFAAHIPPAAAATALDAILEAPGVDPWLFAHGAWYARSDTGSHVVNERVSANAEPVLRRDFSDLLDAADKIVGVSENHALLERMEADLCAKLGDAASVGRSQPYYLDVTARDANKGTGVTTIAAALGAPLAETAVIGDQRNDMAMFAVAGLSIAMGQGPQAVLDAADHVTGSNAEDGVAQAIDRFILPAAPGAQA